MGDHVRKHTLESISRDLSLALGQLRFAAPVAHVYDPTDYARELHAQYLRRFGAGRKQVVFLGMNPGPWGMVQTGVPFGEVTLVRDWMQLSGTVGSPPNPHPKRPVTGLACTRSEVSGARLWGWARDRFGSPEQFFAQFFVCNYCPLAFLEKTGRNRTPDKLPAAEREPLLELCDRALRASIELLQPRWVVGIGGFAAEQARRALADLPIRIGRVLHPSPASPAANRGWADQADKELAGLGIRRELARS
jgi:single-strand selective monofunctional uracil DNA glycosylase